MAVLCAVLLLLLGACVAEEDALWLNTKVSRTISISENRQSVLINLEINMKNVDTGAKDMFLVAVEANIGERVAFLSATMGKGEDKVTLDTCQGGRGKRQLLGYKVFSARLPTPVPPDETIKVKIRMVVVGALAPFPAEMEQGTQHYVNFTGDYHTFLSPYPSERVTTKVKIPGAVVSASRARLPVQVGGDFVTLGPYDSVPVLDTSAPLSVHLEYDAPLMRAARMERTVDVSHWASTATVTDAYDLRNDGAAIRGQFSRYDFMRGLSATNAIAQVSAFLPEQSEPLFFRDVLGNISSSNVISRKQGLVELRLRPRFPIMGGWRAEFEYGFLLPRGRAATKAGGGGMSITVPFGCPIPGVDVDEYTLRLVLPEGVAGVEVDVGGHRAADGPVGGAQVDHELTYSYLDTVGRPTVVVRRRHVVEEHAAGVTVRYRVGALAGVRKPAAVVVVVAALAWVVVALSRLDLSIAPRGTGGGGAGGGKRPKKAQ